MIRCECEYDEAFLYLCVGMMKHIFIFMVGMMVQFYIFMTVIKIITLLASRVYKELFVS
jgi:hypothetical protein